MNKLKKFVVFDTNIIVASLRSRRGASFQLLKLVIEDDPRLQILLSIPLFLEYEAVLKREEQLAANHLQIEDIDTILDMLAARGKKIKIPFLWRPQLNDPKDEMVLEVAANGQAEAIITFNRKDFLPATKRFNFQILSPSAFYAQIQEEH
ncbi:putative toxin-antitoxin system toxin component, PIN family [Candidatus Parabeggiatoa sp. HSG14]|uniref:putative toxin-antitoxin system toxin component, PIN family n=1 Tax=Candidatus Parabeggiatoa sp. HSG14 TaxID=3055593 RepID=UPI0025A86F14|nr:putative toxin-antitoxin system toxin component, PIN family [Thiotrichales bacterium HSG14]